jgi:hypothetical protein
MDGASLYDDDILAWSEQQASALRGLTGRGDLPNQLDLANVAEEIEDVGTSELRAVESLIENILVHLILLWADPDAPAVGGWRGEIVAWRVAMRRRITPSMRSKIGMDDLWRDAVTVACAKLAAWDETKAEAARSVLAGSNCPFDLAMLGTEEFAVPVAVARLLAVARAGAG